MHFEIGGEDFKYLWGFETRAFSEEAGAEDDYKKFLEDNGFGHVKDPQGVSSEMYYIPQPSQLPARLHNTTWVVDRSIEFLEKRDEDRPFFLMTSFIKPHPPFESPTPWNKLYRGPEMPLPKRPQDSENLISFWNSFQNRYKYRDQGIDDNLIRCIKATYYSSISFMDYNLDRLISYLEKNKLMKDTLIVFTSDHGEMLGDYNCFGKRCFLDSAARIPMIMVHPDIPGGGKLCSTPLSLIDIMPTFLQYAGLDASNYCSGESLTDIANGNTSRCAVFGQYHRNEYGVYMAVTEKYKYIYSAPDNKEWLFDRTIDPEETRNRANNPMYTHAADDMRSRVICYLKKDGYTSPIDGDHWKDTPVQQLSQDPDDSLPDIPGYEREFNYRHPEMITKGF